MYNTFECHFKSNKKKQRELGDPVAHRVFSTSCHFKVKVSIPEAIKELYLFDQ